MGDLQPPVTHNPVLPEPRLYGQSQAPALGSAGSQAQGRGVLSRGAENTPPSGLLADLELPSRVAPPTPVHPGRRLH